MPYILKNLLDNSQFKKKSLSESPRYLGKKKTTPQSHVKSILFETVSLTYDKE